MLYTSLIFIKAFLLKVEFEQKSLDKIGAIVDTILILIDIETQLTWMSASY